MRKRYHHHLLRILSSIIICCLTAAVPSGNRTCFARGGRRPETACASAAPQSRHLSPFLPPPLLSNVSSSGRRQGGGDPSFPAFLHIAKNAGGTIHNVRFPESTHLIGFRYGISGPDRFGDNCKDGMSPPREEKKEEDGGDPVITFCVVRHPLSRFVSSMKWKHRGVRTASRFNSIIRHAALALHRKQLEQNQPGFLPSTSASSSGHGNDDDDDDDDDSVLGLDMAKLADAKLNDLDTQVPYCHLQPQTDYIWDEAGARTCHYVLRFEHLQAEFAALARLYGKSAKVGRSVGRSVGRLVYRSVGWSISRPVGRSVGR